MTSDQLQDQILQIARDLLFADSLSPEDDLFDAGLNSIVATQLMNRLRHDLGISVGIHEIFDQLNDDIFNVRSLVKLSNRNSAQQESPIPQVAHQELYDLSYVQRRLWLLDQFNGGQHPSSIPIHIVWHEIIDPAALGTALDALLKKHESLRTQYISTTDGPKQRVVPTEVFPSPLEILELQRDQPEQITRIARAEAAFIFDLAKGPLIKATLARETPAKSHLFLTIHHIASDGWSTSVWLRDLFEFYDQARRGEQLQILPAPTTYKDYAAWHNQRLSERIQENGSFWDRTLFFEDAPVTLPTWKERPPVKSYTGRRLTHFFSPQLSGELKRLSARKNLTLFNTLMSMMGVVLHRYTQQKEIVIGTSVANRNHHSLEDMVGYFLSVIPICQFIESHLTFDDVLKNVAATMTQAIKHQEYPFDLLVNKYQKQRDLSSSPVFNIVALFHNYDNPIIPPEVTVDPAQNSRQVLETDNATCIVDLFLEFFEYDNQLLVNVRYDTNLYDEEQIRRFLTHFDKIGEMITTDSSHAVADYDFLTVQERDRMRLQNPTDHNTNVMSSIASSMYARPDAIALSHNDKNVSYGSLAESMEIIADSLSQHLRIAPGEIVAVLLDRSCELVASILAIWKCQAVYLPIETGSPPDRIEHILNDSAAKILITSANLRNGLRGINSSCLEKTICVDEAHAYRSTDSPAKEDNTRTVEACDCAYVIYTSGSTGMPKGAMVHHGGMMNHLQEKIESLNITSRSRVAFNAPPAFDISIWQMIAPLMKGATIEIFDYQTLLEPEGFLYRLEDAQVTHFECVPSYLSALLDTLEILPVPRKLKSLRFLIVTGEVLKSVLTERWFARYHHIQMVNAYGPTEASDDITQHFMDSPHQGRVPIGRPIRNTAIYILDYNGKPCPTGATGEIVVGGAGVGLGYLNDPEKTHSSFVKNKLTPEPSRLYKTGDLGRYLPDGSIEFLGRKDHQVKLFGYRIELGEIEEHIYRLPEVQEAAVILTQELPQRLIAFVQLKRIMSESEFKEALFRNLPQAMVPAKMIVVKEMPQTSNGKIDRKALQQLSNSAHKDLELPATEIESRVLVIWKTVLRRETLGIHDNFFELGGNSLLANQIITRIHKMMNVKLSMRELFVSQSVAAVAQLIAKATENHFADVPLIEDQDYYQLSHAQRRLWILQHLKDDQIAYNVYGAYKIRGVSDVLLLQDAVLQTVRNHLLLRTTFPTVKSVPVQRAHEDMSSLWSLEIETVTKESHDDAYAHARLKALMEKPFDIENEFPIRITIVIQGEVTYLLLVLHHIVSDGWSKGLLEREIFERYHSLLKREKARVEGGRWQYKDFSAWQNGALHDGLFNDQRNFWLAQFSQSLPGLIDIPSDRSRPEVQSFRGTSTELILPIHLSEKVEAFCQQHRCTQFTALLSVVFVFLHKISNKNDVVVGATLAGRNVKNAENIFGFFVNTLPLRCQLDTQADFAGLLTNVKELVIQTLSNESYPFDLLVDDLNLKRDLGRQTLFDVLFEVHEFEEVVPATEQHGVESTISVQELSTPEVSSIYDLNLIFKKKAGNWILHIRYNSDLFSENLIERFANYFQLLTEQSLENSLTSIDQLMNFYQEPDSSEILVVPALPTIVQRIDDHYYRGDRAAICQGKTKVSFKELVETSSQFAHFLIGHTGKGKLIPILMDRTPDMVKSILAIWRSGNAYLPLDGTLPIERLKYMVDDAAPDTLIFSTAYLKNANQLLWECRSVKQLICVDSWQVTKEREPLNESMRRDLWEYVGESATDDITGGGWIDSYTGLPFSEGEMKEYVQNTLLKLSPHLHAGARVLEIGCASGLTMFEVAPKVQSYIGTDLSRVIIEKNQSRINAEHRKNISLFALYAHEIDQLDQAGFDIIIINSVVQNFNGPNYLREIIEKCVARLGEKGIIFLGDLMDIDKKEALIDSLNQYYEGHTEDDRKTKRDWEDEFFVSREMIEGISSAFPEIINIEFSEKIGTVRNELTEFRFDSILHVNKGDSKVRRPRKGLYDLSHISKEPNAPIDHATPDDIAYVIYTSGSTGNPKGAIVEHRGMSNHLQSKIDLLNLNERSVVAQNASHCFDISVWQFFAAPACGGKTVIYDKSGVQNTSNFLQHLVDDKITVLEVVPTYLNEMLDVVDESTDENWKPTLDFLIVTGEALFKKQVNRWLTRYPKIPLVNAYGPTEASDDITHHVFETAPAEDRVPIGRAIPNMHIRIMTSDGKVCPPGVKGELWVEGVGVGRGYLNDPEKTAVAFIQPNVKAVWPTYRTGDLARQNFDGTITFFGREDFQVKLHGHRIELTEIDQKLMRITRVTEATALLLEVNPGEYSLAAFIGTHASDLTSNFLRSNLMKWLPDYMIPASFYIMDKLPTNTNGKVDRPTLRLHAQIVDTKNKRTLTQTEEKLLGIWRQVLGRDDISVESNFFELGGHSLKATRVLTQILKEFGITISLKDVFLNPTAIELARLIEKADEKGKYKQIPKIADAPYYQLSNAQLRIWVLSQFDGGSEAYTERGAVKITEHLDVGAFSRAVESLVQRHEILRTTFQLIDGEPRQIVHPYRNGLIPLTCQDVIENDRTVSAYDLQQLPLIEFRLIKHADHYAFHYSAHHIICDGWSGRVFLNDILAYYRHHIGADHQSLPPLRIQYRDFAEWENNWLLTPKAQNRYESFWRKELIDVQQLNLPTANPRVPVFSHAGASVHYEFSREFITSLKATTHTTGTSLFMSLVAVINALFYRYTGQDDILIGTSVAGREHPDLEDQIGFYLNTTLIRTKIQSNTNFDALLKNVKRVVLDGLQNQHYPFNKVVEMLKVKRDLSRSALFDVLVELQNFDQVIPASVSVKKAFEQLEIEHIAIEKKASQLDMNWSFYEANDKLFVNLIYNTDLFSKELAMQYLQHFEALGLEMTTHPDQEIQKIQFLTAAEVQRLMFEENRPMDMPALPFIKLFEQQALANPKSIAVRHLNQVVTYEELNDRATAFEAYLVSTGIRAEGLVCVNIERSVDWLVAVLGIFKAGATYVPLDVDLPLQRIIEIIEDGHPEVFVSSNRDVLDVISARITSNGWATKAMTTECLTERSSLKSTHARSLHLADLAYIIYTSGSTGTPKGAMITQQGMLNHLMAKVWDIKIMPDAVVAQTASISFDISIWQLLAPLVVGAECIIVPTETIMRPRDFIHFLQRTRTSILEVVPSYLGVWLDEYETQRDALSRLEYLLITGEALKPSLANRALKVLNRINMVNAYGPTEASDDVTHHHITEELSGDHVPIGKALPNMTVLVADKFFNICPPYVMGEIVVSGICLGRGYLNDIEKTTSRFVTDPHRENIRWYLTGDTGKFRPDGTIEFLGRNDDQVKVNGHRIELGEIESRMMDIDHVREVALKVFQNDQGQNYMCAFVKCERDDMDEIRRHLRRKLPEYMIPAHLIKIDKLPLTANGKIDRAKLLHTPDEKRAIATPSSKAEKDLINVWSALFQRKLISVDDDFFDLGGDSIKAIQLVSRMFKNGYHVDIKDVFQNPTIRMLALHCRPVREHDQSTVSGPVHASPSQDFFLRRYKNSFHHFNFSLLLSLKRPMSLTTLNTIFNEIRDHHDALRMTVVQNGRNLTLFNRPADEGVLTQFFDLSEHERWPEELQRISQNVQSTCDVTADSLMQWLLFKIPDGYRLLVLTHHLVFDGVSIRIFFEDMDRLFEQAHAGHPLSLGWKTSSFKSWTENLTRVAEGWSIAEETKYWTQVARSLALELPKDSPSDEDVVADTSLSRFALTPYETDLLLKSQKSIGTQLIDLLLFAVVNAFGDVFALTEVPVLMEYHGRHAALESTEISRTIGWFSYDYPIIVKRLMTDDIQQGIRQIAEDLQSVPHNGFGFLFLESNRQFLSTSKPAIRVNYMGEFRQETDSEFFSIATESTGPVHSPAYQRECAFDVSFVVLNGTLECQVHYNRTHYKDSTIDEITQRLSQNIRDVASENKQAAAEGAAFTVDDLSLEDVESISRTLEGL